MTRKRSRPAPPLPVDPYESAKVAGLRYVAPEGPGIVRKRTGKGFSYIGVNGKPIRDPEELARIRSLVIPPAWTKVWICPLKSGHLQAVGRDARGRKQYRYHPIYRKIRDETKFSRMIAFAAVLPKIRERVRKDLARPGMPKEKVLATVVRLLESTGIRVGNEEYAKTNGSYGLTTLREAHVEVSGSKLRFHFRGKSGLVHDVKLTDRKLSRIVLECQSIPGEELFHYVGEDGEVSKINSEDVNEYLREAAGDSFTAKDFRTWTGTGRAAELLAEAAFENEGEAKKNLVAAVKTVAAKLGNRPATCRKYYVHPAIMEAYVNGTLLEAMKTSPSEAATSESGLEPRELCVLAILNSQLQRVITQAA